jgi:SAM-dependent methyltransferase
LGFTSPWRFLSVAGISLVALALAAGGRSWIAPTRAPSPTQLPAAHPYRVHAWRAIEDLPQPLAQFDTVFWEPRDTDSMRKQIRDSGFLRGKKVLEIGTGTGLIALCCLQAGAAQVVATDINAAAIANARDNARRLECSERLDLRLVPLNQPLAFSVIKPGERFDLIVSNPPWENDRPQTIAEHALYDPDFRLLRSLLTDARRHLNPGGRMWLAYGCTQAIQEIQTSAPQLGWQVHWLDQRSLAELPPVFLPGLLLELIPMAE